jgi:anthranilate synthase/aminodeoxychorismate synthase-like glutamine amidotransferase
MILLIDNYDSFVFNLARHFERLGQETLILRNDAVTVEQVAEMGPDAVVISPGPCTPVEAGCSIDIVRDLHQKLPILGICLGHQAIGSAFGAKIVRARHPMHGRTSRIRHNQRGVFSGLPDPMTVCRYHSLVIDEATLPPELEITARTPAGSIMAIAHQQFPLVGLQFHPEAILTEHGYTMLASFLDLCGISAPNPNTLSASERAESPPSRALPLAPVTF